MKKKIVKKKKFVMDLYENNPISKEMTNGLVMSKRKVFGNVYGKTSGHVGHKTNAKFL